MTGLEKIRVTILLIGRFVNESITGENVLLESTDFESLGILPEDELDILSVLKEGYRVLNFKYTKPYNAQSFTSEERLELGRFAKNKDLPADYFIIKRQSQKNYTISVNNSFHEVYAQAEANVLKPVKFFGMVDAELQSNQHSLKAVALTSIRGGQVMISLRGGIVVPLGPPLQFGRAPFNFMHYLFAHPFQTINIHDIQEQVEDCKTKTDLTELVRNCHFDKELKKIFFQKTNRKNVHFTPWRELGGKELRDFKEKLLKVREETVKNR